MAIIETNYCSVKGCVRPSRSRNDESFGGVTLRIWLCELHGDDARRSDLELDSEYMQLILGVSARAPAGSSAG